VLCRPHLQIPVKEANDVMVVIRQHGEEVWHKPSDLEMKKDSPDLGHPLQESTNFW
jgi:hypothetical protein